MERIDALSTPPSPTPVSLVSPTWEATPSSPRAPPPAPRRPPPMLRHRRRPPSALPCLLSSFHPSLPPLPVLARVCAGVAPSVCCGGDEPRWSPGDTVLPPPWLEPTGGRRLRRVVRSRFAPGRRSTRRHHLPMQRPAASTGVPTSRSPPLASGGVPLLKGAAASSLGPSSSLLAPGGPRCSTPGGSPTADDVFSRPAWPKRPWV